MLCWSADWALIGRLIVASVIIASFGLDFASVDAIGVSSKMIADVAQDTKLSKKESLESQLQNMTRIYTPQLDTSFIC